MSDRRVVEATSAFATDVNGAPLTVCAGDRFWSDDELVVSRPGLFREVTVRESRPARRTPVAAVETATAEPGSPRKVTRPPASSPSGKGRAATASADEEGTSDA